MKLRYGIPFTIGLLLLCAWLSALVNRDLYWLLAIGAGVCAAWDARELGLRRFDTRFPLEPTGVLVAVALVFPVAYPWYLKLRERAAAGALPPRISDRNPTWLVALLGLGAGLLLVCAVWQPKGIRAMQNLVNGLSDRYHQPVDVTVNNGSDLTVTFTNFMTGADSIAIRDTLAEGVARYVRDHYPGGDSLGSIAVVFLSISRRGMARSTEPAGQYRWRPGEIPAAPPAGP